MSFGFTTATVINANNDVLRQLRGVLDWAEPIFVEDDPEYVVVQNEDDTQWTTEIAARDILETIRTTGSRENHDTFGIPTFDQLESQDDSFFSDSSDNTLDIGEMEWVTVDGVFIAG